MRLKSDMSLGLNIRLRSDMYLELDMMLLSDMSLGLRPNSDMSFGFKKA